MDYKKVMYVVLVGVGLIACNAAKKTQSESMQKTAIKSVVAAKPIERAHYMASRTRVFDLLHTKLDVRFDWDSTFMYGKATLKLKPYFYKTTRLVLDAKGFHINFVGLDSEHKLPYSYDGEKLSIELGKEYSRHDTLSIFVDYISKPNERKQGDAGAAITSDKGLFFINPDGTEDKPQQIWTQGETETNSVWFPTIDAPNERCTQEIAIRVKEKFQTLSNGILTHQEINGDGTRTDFWHMDMPHAPYLFMMTVGEFSIIKDNWADKQVHYYVEKEFAPYAKDIFGKTPEMLTFYSKVLGVTYPWPKYHQVVVRDYVSGAMENTSAVIHGDFLHQTKRELIDSDHEDIIAHELFHHWFGDYVTCESWANLPLNESFATYGEYLWFEHDKGKDAADYHIQRDLLSYLDEAKGKQVPLIRFGHEDSRKEMFDAHSYQKGGRVLHMLRNHVGDDAFFAGLQKYLIDNQFSDVEIHELRIAFEEITGEDLNWFFNQWFLSAGHPELSIRYAYNDSLKRQTVTVKQHQDFSKTPLFRFPVKIAVYENGTKKVYQEMVDKVSCEFTYAVSEEPELVDFDMDKYLLCEKVDLKKSTQNWANLYRLSEKYLGRYEGLKKCVSSSDSVAILTVENAIKDNFWKIRQVAIRGVENLAKEKPVYTQRLLENVIANDPNSKVRSAAIDSYALHFSKDNENYVKVMDNAMRDSSYWVISEAIMAYAAKDSIKALDIAKKYEASESNDIVNSVARVYANDGGEKHNKFFLDTYKNLSGYELYVFMQSYATFMSKQEDDMKGKSLDLLNDVATNEGTWWVRYSAIRAMKDMQLLWEDDIDLLKKQGKDSGQKDGLVDKVSGLLEEIKRTEKHPTLQKFLDQKEVSVHG